MGYEISKSELIEVRKMIIGTHGLTRENGARSVIYYVFETSNQTFGALWYAGLTMHTVDLLLNPKDSGYPYAFIGSRDEVKKFCKDDILSFVSKSNS
jgi:hypothetical protein